MRRIVKSSVPDKEWDEIVAKANQEKTALLKAFDDIGDVEIDDSLYKRFMRYLLGLTNKKCAYCESLITSTHPGDVEHFRPKGRVVDEKFKPIEVNHPTRGNIQHPGYYWLAYDWDNLLPSCIDCNRYRRHEQADENAKAAGAGKADRFPLADEADRACTPEQLSRETPLLIDPSKVDPTKHFEFLPGGLIRPLTPEGRVTLEIFGLNLREDLREARARAHDDAANIIKSYWNDIRNVEETRKNAKRVNAIVAGDEPYTTMQLLGLDSILDVIHANVGLRIPLPLHVP